MLVINILILLLIMVAWIACLATAMFISLFIFPSSIRKKIENYHDLD